MKTGTADQFSQDGLRFYANVSLQEATELSKSAPSITLVENRAYMDGMETPFIDLGPGRKAVSVSEADYNILPNPCYL